jgi:uncharacterized GH25 family protein
MSRIVRLPPLRRGLLGLALLGLLGLIPAPARAHDFWIEPSGFHLAPGGRATVRLRVGQQFRGDPMPREAKRIERFAAVGPAGEIPVPGVEGGEPAGFLVFPQAPGLYWIVYDSSRESIELEAAKFEPYLKDEGLDAVIAARAKKGQSAQPGREVYSRCAKALIAVGPLDAPGYDRVLGLELELVPEKNPLLASPGSALPVRLLYRGKPLKGALVAAFTKEHPEAKVALRTDAAGRVTLPLAGTGHWLIKAVHMVPAPAGTGADWESLWASVTFEIAK